ncbi:MAG: 1-deoxy-D-xylulose-5-phosphate reductoisomerase [Treponema sp.]|jgi:1-deoxy-D-xylulose-5-phosphate reductoisomerase|nr:1-deoxy-D-xylulose-5-phosphate reductoisomerase [Treponema sp.]
MKKKICLLGASGSIGTNTLDVIRQNPDAFEPVLFSTHSNREILLSLKKEFPNAVTALSGFENTADNEISFTGKQGLLEAIARSGADMAVNGIAGAAGLEPSLACIDSGMDLALANKETIVMAGPLVLSLAHEKRVNIIPVDSEHSAIFRLLEAHGKDAADEIILTASGGPFRAMPKEKLKTITREDALAHPTWNMGPKITIDSATLANKGLEVIEAQRLFGFPPEKIRVVIHPQSIVHSLIRLKDGAVYAQLSKPDMRLPIHDALFWPDCPPSPFGKLDFENLALNFEKPDTEKFPMLSLAYEACNSGPLSPVVYNAANETAVDAFLSGRISFLEISRIVEYVLDKCKPVNNEINGIEPVLEIDKKARETASGLLKNLSL